MSAGQVAMAASAAVARKTPASLNARWSRRGCRSCQDGHGCWARHCRNCCAQSAPGARAEAVERAKLETRKNRRKNLPTACKLSQLNRGRARRDHAGNGRDRVRCDHVGNGRRRRAPRRLKPNRRQPNRRQSNRRIPNRRKLNRHRRSRHAPNRRSKNRRNMNRRGRALNRRAPSGRAPSGRSLNRRAPNRRAPPRRNPGHHRRHCRKNRIVAALQRL